MWRSFLFITNCLMTHLKLLGQQLSTSWKSDPVLCCSCLAHLTSLSLFLRIPRCLPRLFCYLISSLRFSLNQRGETRWINGDPLLPQQTLSSLSPVTPHSQDPIFPSIPGAPQILTFSVSWPQAVHFFLSDTALSFLCEKLHFCQGTLCMWKTSS